MLDEHISLWVVLGYVLVTIWVFILSLKSKLLLDNVILVLRQIWPNLKLKGMTH